MRNLIEFLDLGLQPLANNYLSNNQKLKKEKKYRLKVLFNKKTKMVSIKNSKNHQMVRYTILGWILNVQRISQLYCHSEIPYH